jgi:hypothetical protein
MSATIASLLIPFYFLGQTVSTSTDYYFNGQLHWQGDMLTIGNNSSPTGLWQYWHEDGKLKLQTWDNPGIPRTFYLNCWLPGGEQILKNGEGYITIFLSRRESTIRIPKEPGDGFLKIRCPNMQKKCIF